MAGVYEMLAGKKLFVPPKWVIRVGVLLLFVACCQAWFDEHRNVEALIHDKTDLWNKIGYLQAQLDFKNTPLAIQVAAPNVVRKNSKRTIQQQSSGANMIVPP